MKKKETYFSPKLLCYELQKNSFIFAASQEFKDSDAETYEGLDEYTWK